MLCSPVATAASDGVVRGLASQIQCRLDGMTAHFLIVALPLILERTPAAGAKHLI